MINADGFDANCEDNQLKYREAEMHKGLSNKL